MVENVKIEVVYDCLENGSENDSDIAPDNLLEPRHASKKQKLIKTQKLSKTHHAKPAVIYCGLCPATFGRQDHLKRHIECLHSSFTFCKCPVCNKQFANEAAVKKHVKASHSQRATFKCRVCQTDFNCFSKLSKHEVTHLISRHKCPECGVQFKRRDHMLRHVKSQHLNQHEVCPHCGQTLKRKDHLTKHLREKHSIIEPATPDGILSSAEAMIHDMITVDIVRVDEQSEECS